MDAHSYGKLFLFDSYYSRGLCALRGSKGGQSQLTVQLTLHVVCWHPVCLEALKMI